MRHYPDPGMNTITREVVGEHWNEGARQAWLAMRAKGWKQSDLNREIGVALNKPPRLGYASRILYADRKPGLDMALIIERLLGVSPTLWSMPAIEPFSLALTGGRTRTPRAA